MKVGPSLERKAPPLYMIRPTKTPSETHCATRVSRVRSAAPQPPTRLLNAIQQIRFRRTWTCTREGYIRRWVPANLHSFLTQSHSHSSSVVLHLVDFDAAQTTNLTQTKFYLISIRHVWTWKRWQGGRLISGEGGRVTHQFGFHLGSRKGWCQASS